MPIPMTPRQRWLTLLSGRPADRVPADYQATGEVTARLLTELGCADQEALFARLHVDHRRFVEPTWKPSQYPGSPVAADEPTAVETTADMWGVRFRKVSYGGGSYDEPCHQPLAQIEHEADVHVHRWPNPDDFDYQVITRTVLADDRTHPIHAGCYEPFLLYGQLRGLEQAFADLALRPEIADAILGHIFDFYYEFHRRIFEAGRGRIDLTWVAEDLGGQTGPLISRATYQRFLLPNQVKMADLARSYGVHVMYHTDGAARVFLPDLLDKVGIEILNPIQWRSPGMEREKLVAEFGDRIVFHGSIDNQQTLAFGTVEDVVRDVRESREIYRDARWICAPCHNLQPVSPTKNILALYDTIHELGGG